MKKTLILFFLISFLSNTLFAKAPKHECDTLAAHPDDQFKVGEGIEWDDLISDKSIIACEEALDEHPNETRFLFQLARANLKNENFEKSFDLFTQASIKNYPMAHFLLGLMSYYQDGDLDNYNLEFQITSFEKAFQLDKTLYDESKFHIASSYYYYKQYNKAIDLYLELEKQINNDNRLWILFELGSAYYYSIDNSYKDSGTAKNAYINATTYYKKILNENLLDGPNEFDTSSTYHKLAYSLYELGNIEESINFYLKSIDYLETAENLSEDSFLKDIYLSSYGNLAEIYNEQKEFLKTIDIYEHLLKFDPTYTTIYAELSWMYSEGYGVTQDHNKALEILLKASNLEDSSLVNNNIGLKYERGVGAEQSYLKAKEYYEKSIKEKTSIVGFLNLGFLYEEGLGVQLNIDKAKEIYLEGINLYKNSHTIENYIYTTIDEDNYQDLLDAVDYLNNEDNIKEYTQEKQSEFNPELVACETLIEMVQAGYDQKSNFDKCLKLADSGNVDAQYYIGVFYTDGYVVNKNYSKAATWFKKSLAQGDVYSKYEYSKLLLNGYAIDDEINLINLLNEIILDEDNVYFIQSLYNLGIAYKYGIYVEKNIDEALSIFDKVIKYDQYDDYNIYTKELAIDRGNEIRSIKAGFAIENPIINKFPIELNGESLWEESDDKTSWKKVIFSNIKEVGPDRFEIKGHYHTDDGDNIVYVNLKGKINSKLKSIEIWEYNPISSDPDFDPEFDWVTKGSYVGFYDDDFNEINAFWIPESSGSRGTLKLKNNNVLRGDIKPEIVDLKKQLNFGNYYAIVIGNNNYENLEQLDTARIDATTVAKVLENKYGFEVLEVLTDATEKDIISNLYSINKELSSYDNLLIYYAGHGYMDEETKRGYWLPVDANTIESQDTSSWISVDDISNILTKLSPKHILVVADSCYSGSLVLRSADNNLSELPYKHFKQLLEKKTRKALTSGALQPVADGGGQGHSVFASAFLKILSDNNTVIDTNSIYNQLNTLVSSSPITDQTPLYNVVPRTGDEGGDFIFVPQN